MLVASNAASPRNVFGFIKGCFWKSQLKLEEVLSNRQGIYPHPVNLISSPQRYQDVFQKVLVVESDVTNNTKPVRNNAKFIGVTEMSIDVHLLDCLIGSRMSWHRAISSFIRIIGIIKVMGFFESLQLLDNTVGIFGVVFCNPCFNARRYQRLS